MPTLEEVLSSGRGVERSFNCPSHNDSNASASVNAMSGLWCCYACGASGRVDGRTVSPSVLASALAHALEPRSVRRMSERWLDVFDAEVTSPYWAGRVGAATAELFRCGQHPETGFPTYPLRDDTGGVLGVVQRQPAPLEPKYLYPQGVSVSRCLFGYERAHRRSVVLLCEGAADVMNVSAALGRNAPVSPLGVFGSSLHQPQVRLLKRLRPQRIVVGFDNDEAGRRGAERTVAVLRRAGVSASMITPPAGAGDWGDATHEQIRSMKWRSYGN